MLRRLLLLASFFLFAIVAAQAQTVLTADQLQNGQVVELDKLGWKYAPGDDPRQLQLSILPKKLPNLPHLDLAAYMKTASEVGGDYYDFHLHSSRLRQD